MGFEFHQRLGGFYHLLDAPGDERPLSVTVRAQVHDTKRFLLAPRAELSGEIDAGGLADHKPLRGLLEIRPLADAKLVYDFRFPTDEGRERRFRGGVEVDLRQPVETLTTVPGSLYAEEREIGRALLRLRLRTDLWHMIRSFRTR